MLESSSFLLSVGFYFVNFYSCQIFYGTNSAFQKLESVKIDEKTLRLWKQIWYPFTHRLNSNPFPQTSKSSHWTSMLKYGTKFRINASKFCLSKISKNQRKNASSLKTNLISFYSSPKLQSFSTNFLILSLNGNAKVWDKLLNTLIDFP